MNWKAIGKLFLGSQLFASLHLSCVTQPVKYPTVDSVDIERYMGDWYVQGHTPVFFDKDSTDQVESYKLQPDGSIATHYYFKRDGETHNYHPHATVYDKVTNAHWKMQFLWPFTSDFLIVRLDPDYKHTVVSVPDKKQIWVMSRSPQMTENLYQEIVDNLARDNYPVSLIKRVSHGNAKPLPSSP